MTQPVYTAGSITPYRIDLTTSPLDNNSVISVRDSTATWTVAPTAEEIAELKDDSGLLYALIDSGVEEWDGYNKAIALWRERRDN